ncbi:MAG: hypothetical protein ACP59X_08275 [Solidesulfovibrio sp. DCME]|uniref:hypothetical protein n=1 Tax=Solidesulfovibrio sp. DCME TaxID=3447380 RepID=UPI003D13719E
MAGVALVALLLAVAGGTPGLARAADRPPAFVAAELTQVGDPVLRQELESLAAAFEQAVTDRTVARFGRKNSHKRVDLISDPPLTYRNRLRADALAKLRAAGLDANLSQCFLYVDRNPATQVLFLAYYDAPGRHVVFLGADLFSSGKLRVGEDSFLTPLGVYENLTDNWGYRAAGTKNAKGWRGLGGRGSRVWDFGYQQAPRQFRQGIYESQMRLLMHATDPDQGEPRLGGPDSKGCVRISAAANAFIDHRGILDRHYERMLADDSYRARELLGEAHAPVSHPGSFLVVGDSAIESASREAGPAPTGQ